MAEQSLSGEPWKCALHLNTSLLFHNPYYKSLSNYVLHSHRTVYKFRTSAVWNNSYINFSTLPAYNISYNGI